MKWMKLCQRSYRDAQLEFWLLLRPLTDGREEHTRQLARRLLSVWHWSSAVDPPMYPPTPTSMNIGYWLRETRKKDNQTAMDRGLRVCPAARGQGLRR